MKILKSVFASACALTCCMGNELPAQHARAHHIADIDYATSEYWRNIHGYSWLTCAESQLAQGNLDELYITQQCAHLSIMNIPKPATRGPWGDFNPFDNPFKDSTIQAPNIFFGL